MDMFLTTLFAYRHGEYDYQFHFLISSSHTETVCLLGRRKLDDTIKVSVNMDDYYQIRDAEEAEKTPS